MMTYKQLMRALEQLVALAESPTVSDAEKLLQHAMLTRLFSEPAIAAPLLDRQRVESTLSLLEAIAIPATRQDLDRGLKHLSALLDQPLEHITLHLDRAGRELRLRDHLPEETPEERELRRALHEAYSTDYTDLR